MQGVLERFGQHLKELRKKENLTQQEFAIRSGLHRNYIGMLERGERNPSLKNLELISMTLKITLSELMDF
ncbi:MAG: helix-turn-helix transcriptional regulator [Dysgonamonadaceae bacterium]|nr:helix-turn-helix transcriptional regulator [Dysgonamonadaceae bacterium]MDD4727704.1 helix-turn-helix transcriptional regulator [Dysgonamonadaceae bacterium]